jgi:DNA-binding transcriptional LysR family regulator
MTYKQLEYFLAIAETSNMTMAAAKLNISQPPLSYHLKILEEELQVKLFNREGHTLQITNEGRIFQDKAMQILALTNQSISLMQNIGKEMFGTINIATIPSVCGSILPKNIYEFQLKYPDVNYKIHECNTFRAMELLDNGLVDFAFVRAPFNQERYQIMMVKNPFLKENQKDFFVAIGSETFLGDTKEDSIDLQKLIGKPLIVHRRYKKILDSLCEEKNISLQIVCENDYIGSSFYMADAAIGVAVMPYTSAMLFDNKKSLLIKKIEHPTIDSQIYLITKKNTTLPLLSKKFIEQINLE